MTDKVDMFCREAMLSLKDLLDKSGSVLYSSYETLRPGEFYLLGLNPGGDPDKQKEDTIRKHLESLPGNTKNAYIDEYWEPYRKGEEGEAPLQKRLYHLFNKFGCDIKNVCASNLIFLRSRNSGGSGYPEIANKCWDVHEKIINIVRPKCIIVFGNSAVSPYQYIYNKFKPNCDVQSINSGHGKWLCKVFRTSILGLNVVVAGLPHMSRYAIDRHDAVIDWVKSQIN
jgi:hypothetical protein